MLEKNICEQDEIVGENEFNWMLASLHVDLVAAVAECVKHPIVGFVAPDENEAFWNLAFAETDIIDAVIKEKNTPKKSIKKSKDLASEEVTNDIEHEVVLSEMKETNETKEMCCQGKEEQRMGMRKDNQGANPSLLFCETQTYDNYSIFWKIMAA